MRVEHFSAATGGAANITLKFTATPEPANRQTANDLGYPDRQRVWHGEHVAHAIEMYFDDQADAAVRRLWELLAEAGLPSLATRTHRRHRPHVSLVVAESLADADLAPLRAVLMSRRPALSLYVLGTFPGTEGLLILGVQVTAELLVFHAGVHAALAGQPIRHWAYYLPGNWIPHCALAEGLDRSEAGQAFGLLADYEPITAEVTSVGMKDTATGAVTMLTA
jgi:hypothetical protein